jgi:hypothetical protein
LDTEDDAVYRRSVRNMSFVLAAIVITIFAAIFIPPYLSPQHDVFQQATSFDSAFGFAMHLQVNSTSVPSGGTVLVSGWINSTAGSIENITSADSWGMPVPNLWTAPCQPGWPVGVGIMQGHYTSDNYSLGALLNFSRPLYLPACALQGNPSYFLLEPHSSKALVTLSTGPVLWVIQTSFSFGTPTLNTPLKPGVYTAVLADEWGDVLTANFLVS